MKYIELSTRGKHKGLYRAIVSNKDFARVSKVMWQVVQHSNGLLYATHRFKGKIIKMHRFILDVTNPGIIVDHRDGNGLNNQRRNIRICTHMQNMHNSKGRKTSTSTYKGVSIENKVRKYKAKRGDVVWRKTSYRAQIRVKNRHYYLGNFKTEIEAALAYDKAAKKLHKSFAKLNFK